MVNAFHPKHLTEIRKAYSSHILYQVIYDACCSCCEITEKYQLRQEQIFAEVIYLIDQLKANQQDIQWDKLYRNTRQDFKMQNTSIPAKELDCITATIIGTLASVLATSHIEFYQDLAKSLFRQIYLPENNVPEQQLEEMMDGLEKYDAQIAQWLTNYMQSEVFIFDDIQQSFSNIPYLEEQPREEPKKEVQLTKNYMTFCMADINVGHVNLLRQKLIEFGWIPKDTQPDAFSNLFSGMPNNTKIVWTGKVGKGTLAYLFKKMEEQQKITVPQSYNINPILEAHFVDKNGKYLTGLHKGKDALRHLPNIQKCLDVLYLDVDFD